MARQIPGFRQVAQTGVIYVTSQAAARGFTHNDPEWANLGQGSPESGEMAGAPPRIKEHCISTYSHRYAPVAGEKSLRQRIAEYYNETYRQGKSSQYTWENVCIAGGGRQALSRLVAALGNINMGHFLPDYTAYEELLSAFRLFNPIPILLERENNFRIDIDTLKREVLGRGLRCVLISNPCNPTGQIIENEELKQWVDLARSAECSFIMDEFYSHYIYSPNNPHPNKMLSAAEFVDDVNTDPLIIVDGLTKNWRYPGWRISWIVAPTDIIETVSSVGSFLDGGANHPFQLCSQQLLDAKHIAQETQAIHQVFSEKRDYTLKRLYNMGIQVHAEPMGGFYVWADISKLPEPLNNSLSFFKKGLDYKVITVPGYFFDVNPGGRRIKTRRFLDHVRISFGPDMQTLKHGLDALESMICKI